MKFIMQETFVEVSIFSVPTVAWGKTFSVLLTSEVRIQSLFGVSDGRGKAMCSSLFPSRGVCVCVCV